MNFIEFFGFPGAYLFNFAQCAGLVGDMLETPLLVLQPAEMDTHRDSSKIHSDHQSRPITANH